MTELIIWDADAGNGRITWRKISIDEYTEIQDVAGEVDRIYIKDSRPDSWMGIYAFRTFAAAKAHAMHSLQERNNWTARMIARLQKLEEKDCE